jgi:type II secretory pathway component PulK
MRRRDRRGFALLAALWVTVGLSAMALTGLLIARSAVTAAWNRIALMRGRWRAEDCLERARAVIDDALSGGQAIPRRIAGGWNVLDRVVAASPAITEAACDVTLRPTGIAVDVNAADAEQLLALLRVLSIAEPRADSMVNALLDWRDADDIARPTGAESGWYRAVGGFSPRNGPLADVRELRRVRGFDEAMLPDSVLDVVFTVEPGRIVWDRAPLAVIASVPGIGEEALARITELRFRGVALADVTALGRDLSPSAREFLDARYADVQRLTTDRPDAWIATARGGGATIEVRLARAGARAAIVRRRTTP